ncbi:hypothetical protein LTR97_009551 [Elasticomyces elasticus]|uniref:BTB domain-containing protein n=1 Tax=Elasticomyces elasticus TaxID=574655 RepID=A0AAN7VMS5_9PEZI|nr:hypothetical protein LTR97_009551 [Elasticomyces elasticus]
MDGKEFIRYEERNHYYVNVHALRAASKPFAELLGRMKPNLNIDLDAPFKGFKIFANWLKEGEVPMSSDTSLTALQDLCSAYQVGKQFEVSPHFLDEVMDSIVHAVLQTRVLEHRRTHRDGQDTGAIIKQLRTTFEQDSLGRRFLVDWLVHGDLTEASGETIWAGGLASEVKKDAALHAEVSVAMFREKLCKTSLPPWLEDGHECDYHAHVTSGLPCHSSQSY